MLNKHLLKFQVNGGEDNRKNVGKKIFECLGRLCASAHVPTWEICNQAHYIYKYRMMAPRIQSVSPPRGITDQQCPKTTTRCSGGSTDSVVREKNSAFWLHHSLSESP